jgi:hypothetical protein
VQERENTEAQEATKQGDATLDGLDEWMANFKAIAQVALEEHPQWAGRRRPVGEAGLWGDPPGTQSSEEGLRSAGARPGPRSNMSACQHERCFLGGAERLVGRARWL